MDYNLVEKEYQLIHEPIFIVEKNWILKYLLHKNKELDNFLLYGELLEEIEEE